MGKGDFVGRSALVERIKAVTRKSLVTLKIDCDHTPAHGGASVYASDELIGTITSGEWGHRTQQNLAYAFVETSSAGISTQLAVDIIDQRVSAEVVTNCQYDPEHSRMRQ